MEGFQEYTRELEKQDELYYEGEEPVVTTTPRSKTSKPIVFHQCDRCRFKTTHCGALGTHRTIHMYPTVFCDVCGCGFKLKKGLAVHAEYCNGGT